jgi:hypothetical protein
MNPAHDDLGLSKMANFSSLHKHLDCVARELHVSNSCATYKNRDVKFILPGK